MLYLVLSIITTASLFLLFKYFEKYRVNTFQAVVFNYLTASLVGFVLNQPIELPLSKSVWFPLTFFMGMLFISIFYLLGYTAQKISVSASSVANKMSMIIPVAAAVYLYGDKLNVLKVVGIITALLAVFFTSMRDKSVVGNSNRSFNKSLILFPVILFLGSGLLDSLLKFAQAVYLRSDNFGVFISFVFGFSFLAGFIIMILNPAHRKSFAMKNVYGGMILGTLNYFSVLFFLNALEIPTLESSVIFPMNNIGIVACSTVGALLLFKEKLSRYNWLGIGLSVLSIIIISFA